MLNVSHMMPGRAVDAKPNPTMPKRDDVASPIATTADLFSFDYHRAMKILLAQGNARDWELESAAHYVRKSTLHRSADLYDAEANLRDVLQRRFN